MFAYIIQNLATLLVSAFLLAVVVWISVSLIKKKKSGKTIGCGCGCGSCPSASLCGRKSSSDTESLEHDETRIDLYQANGAKHII